MWNWKWKEKLVNGKERALPSSVVRSPWKIAFNIQWKWKYVKYESESEKKSLSMGKSVLSHHLLSDHRGKLLSQSFPIMRWLPAQYTEQLRGKNTFYTTLYGYWVICCLSEIFTESTFSVLCSAQCAILFLIRPFVSLQTWHQFPLMIPLQFSSLDDAHSNETILWVFSELASL